MAGSEGSVFGKFFLLKRIASGGMGEIFLAKLRGPVGFEKLLVVKRILQHHLENQDFVDMFFAEARVAAKLTHSNIVQIYEMGEIEDCYYIAMEYVHGKSLRDLLDRARIRGEHLHPAHAIEIISKVCNGMSYAHNAADMSGQDMGVIHRDLNPHNLLISYSGEVKIIDFGIAKSHLSINKTETGTIKGKFVYMSPEQSAAEPLDKRSDLFSIGICAYEALTFVNPFAKANVVLSLEAIQRQDPPPLAQQNPRYAILDPIILKALAKNRAERFADCVEFSQALQRLRDSGEISPPPQSLKEFMHDLFEEQIESEKRMILETDSANTSQIQLMQQGLEREHQSGSHSGYRLKVQQQAAHASAVALAQPLPHSRLPFILLLAAILIVSGIAATVVYELTRRKQVADPSTFVAELLPAPEPPAGVPTAMLPKPPNEPTAPPPRAENPPAGSAENANDGRSEEDNSRRTKRGKPPPSLRGQSPGRPAAKGTDRSPPEPTSMTVATAPEPPAPPAPPPAPSFGNLQISTLPGVKLFRDGASVGQTLKLKSPTGKLQIGSGSDPQTDPFTVRITYKVDGDTISYAIQAEPWAIVQGEGGMGLGRTPLPNLKGEGKTILQLVNPQNRLSLRITLRFTR